MDITKRYGEKLVYIFLILYPFGQLIRFSFDFLGKSVPIHPIDAVAGLALPFLLIKNKPKIWKSISAFLLAAVFSYLFSFIIFQSNLVIFGGLYLLRLISYFSFFLAVYFSFKRQRSEKEVLFKSLIAVSLVVSLFGWVQYFWYPDFRPFAIFGWDDHLYRMVGTLFDPGFTSLIYAFGGVLSLYSFLKTEDKRYVLLFLFFLLTLLFTYARSGYVAFFAGALALLFLEKKLKVSFIILVGLVVGALFLPRPASEGVVLERTASIFARFDNYEKTYEIFKQSPIFGVGYNNLCLAKMKYLGEGNLDSHSCFGADMNIILVLATTGVIGFMTLLRVFYKGLSFIKSSKYKNPLIAVVVAYLTHGLFVNSLFYPWSFSFVLILFAISLKE